MAAYVKQLSCFLFSTRPSTHPSPVEFVSGPILQLPHLEIIHAKWLLIKITKYEADDFKFKTVIVYANL